MGFGLSAAGDLGASPLAGRDYRVGLGRYRCAVPCTRRRACGVHNTLYCVLVYLTPARR